MKRLGMKKVTGGTLVMRRRRRRMATITARKIWSVNHIFPVQT